MSKSKPNFLPPVYALEPLEPRIMMDGTSGDVQPSCIIESAGTEVDVPALVTAVNLAISTNVAGVDFLTKASVLEQVNWQSYMLSTDSYIPHIDLV